LKKDFEFFSRNADAAPKRVSYRLGSILASLVAVELPQPILFDCATASAGRFDKSVVPLVTEDSTK